MTLHTSGIFHRCIFHIAFYIYPIIHMYIYIYTWSYMYALLRDLRPDLLRSDRKRLNALTFHRGMQRLALILHILHLLFQCANPGIQRCATLCHCQPPWPVSATAREFSVDDPLLHIIQRGCQCECWQVAACYFLGVHQGWKKSWCCWERHRVRRRSCCPAFSPLETSHTLESPWFKRWKLSDHTMGLFDMGDGMNRLVVRCTLCVPLAVDFLP